MKLTNLAKLLVLSTALPVGFLTGHGLGATPAPVQAFATHDSSLFVPGDKVPIDELFRHMQRRPTAGKQLVTIFYAPGCASCASEVPVWQEMSATFATTHELVLFTTLAGSLELDTNPVSRSSQLDAVILEPSLLRTFRVRGSPTIYVIRDGRVTASYDGELATVELERHLLRGLDERPGAGPG
ncbi:MAG TPA: hypothetical protein VF039_03955 [Longimicrobiales bacterium]